MCVLPVKADPNSGHFFGQKKPELKVLFATGYPEQFPSEIAPAE